MTEKSDSSNCSQESEGLDLGLNNLDSLVSGRMNKINTPVKSTEKGLETRNSEKVTSEKSPPQKYPTMTSSQVASLVKVFPLRDNVEVFKTSQGELFSSKSAESYEIKDQNLLLENVKGLLSHDSGRTFAIILLSLDELGYDAEWFVANTKYYLPQNRERVFIFGVRR